MTSESILLEQSLFERIQIMANELNISYNHLIEMAIDKLFPKYFPDKAKDYDKKENQLWNDFSLQSAINGLENEVFSEYDVNDLKEIF